MISVEWSEMGIKSKDACMWVSPSFFFKIVKNLHMKMTPLICYDYVLDRTSKTPAKVYKKYNYMQKALIRQNLLSIQNIPPILIG